MKKTKLLRVACIAWCLFIGLGAVGGAVTMFIDPMGKQSGMAGLLPGLRKLPFADALFSTLTFSGVALLVVNGLTQLVTAALLLARRPRGSACALGCGVLLMLWITIQFFIFPMNWLSGSYFVFGLAEAACGWALLRGERAA